MDIEKQDHIDIASNPPDNKITAFIFLYNSFGILVKIKFF